MYNNRTANAVSGNHRTLAIDFSPSISSSNLLDDADICRIARQKSAVLSFRERQLVDSFIKLIEDSEIAQPYAVSWLSTFNALPTTKASISSYNPLHMRRILDSLVIGQDRAKQVLLRNIWWSDKTGVGRFKVLLQGPPGVGKTLLVESLKKITNRPVRRIDCDMLTEASNLVGDQPNYQAAGLGAILGILVGTQVQNPIVFFDEIDKIAITSQGYALFHVLNSILDNTRPKIHNKYLNMDIDLTHVAFVSTANQLERLKSIPSLYDRLGEVVKMDPCGRNIQMEIIDKYFLKVNREYRSCASFTISIEVVDFLLDLYNQQQPEGGVRLLVEVWLPALVKEAASREEYEISRNMVEQEFTGGYYS